MKACRTMIETCDTFEEAAALYGIFLRSFPDALCWIYPPSRYGHWAVGVTM